jgi:hypothetical protein
MVWVAAGRSGIGRRAAERRAYEDRAVDVSRCVRIKKPARQMPAGAVRRIAFRQVRDLAIRVKPGCRIAKTRSSAANPRPIRDQNERQ